MLIIFILDKDCVGKYRISAEEDRVLLFSNVPEAAVDCKKLSALEVAYI